MLRLTLTLTIIVILGIARSGSMAKFILEQDGTLTSNVQHPINSQHHSLSDRLNLLQKIMAEMNNPVDIRSLELAPALNEAQRAKLDRLSVAVETMRAHQKAASAAHSENV